jgi:CRP-like cAMP-binding protein
MTRKDTATLLAGVKREGTQRVFGGVNREGTIAELASVVAGGGKGKPLKKTFTNSVGSVLKRVATNGGLERQDTARDVAASPGSPGGVVAKGARLGAMLSAINSDKMWSRVKTAVKISGAIGRVSKESESTRRARIKRHWDLVRQIARAAISLKVLNEHSDRLDSKNGIKHYSRFVKVLEAHPALRTPSDLDFLVAATRSLDFFSKHAASAGVKNVEDAYEITDSQHLELCRTMRLRRFAESRLTVFEQGDTGEEFFIILEGSVTVHRRVGEASVSRVIARLEAGKSFGEQALLGTSKGMLRTASIVTDDRCAFLVIHKNDYIRILRDAHQELFDLKLKFLRKVFAVRDLPDQDIFNLAVSMSMHKVRVGREIVREGTPLDPLRFFIIVKRGEVEVLKKVRIAQCARRGDVLAAGSGDHARQHSQDGDGEQEQFRICLLGPTETVCDSRLLDRREDAHYRYPFSIVAKTLVEFYCLAKHDLLNKLSKESLATIHALVSKIPDERTIVNAFAVAVGWREYKSGLIREVLAGRRSDAKSVVGAQAVLRARKLESQLAIQMDLKLAEQARAKAKAEAQARESKNKSVRDRSMLDVSFSERAEGQGQGQGGRSSVKRGRLNMLQAAEEAVKRREAGEAAEATAVAKAAKAAEAAVAAEAAKAAAAAEAQAQAQATASKGGSRISAATPASGRRAKPRPPGAPGAGPVANKPHTPRPPISGQDRSRRTSARKMRGAAAAAAVDEPPTAASAPRSARSPSSPRSANADSPPPRSNNALDNVLDVRKETSAIDLAERQLSRRQEERKRIAAEQHRRTTYSQAAAEMDAFLADGFSLTRHVYDNALSEGARLYCKAVAFM